MALIRCGLALGMLFAVTAAAGTDGPLWWQLVPAQINEAPAAIGVKSISTEFSHPLDLLIPQGWELHGEVHFPHHQGSPSLTFAVSAPDGLMGLEYLPREAVSWSGDPGTRSHLLANGFRVQHLPPATAVEYLRAVLVPALHPDARSVAIERLPQLADYLNEELSGTNIAAKVDADKNGLPAPISTADAARARITYLRDGVAVEEWLEIAIQHLQRREDLTPPWRPGETGRLYVGPNGPLIDTFTVVECDRLWAPAGTLAANGRILASVLGTLHENYQWERETSFERWHGQFDDRVIYFRPSFFGANPFRFTDPADAAVHEFAFANAWSGEPGAGFIVTDAADFDPNQKVGTRSWQRLKPQATP